MRRFKYKIEDDEVERTYGEVEGIPSDFLEHKNNFGLGRIYYKIEGGKITEVIAEASNEEIARMRIDDFISALNVNLL